MTRSSQFNTHCYFAQNRQRSMTRNTQINTRHTEWMQFI